MRDEPLALAKPGKKSAGPIGAYFVEPIIEDGVFAGGMLRGLPAKEHAKALRHPAWRLVRLLAPDLTSPRKRRATAADVLALAERDELVSLASIYGIAESSAAKLATGPSRPLTALGVVDCYESDHDAIARCKALPKLRTLAIELRKDTVAWLVDAPVLSRIERLVVSGVGDLGKLLGALAKSKRALREIVIMTGSGIPEHGEGWTLRLTRDGATGAFTRLHGTYRTPRKGGKTLFAASLAGPLGAIPASWLESLTLDTTAAKSVTIPLEDRRELDTLVARFESAKDVRVPWSPATAKKETKATTKGHATYELRLRGPVGLLDAKTFAPTWKLFVEEAGQSYDAFTTTTSGAHRKLTPGKEEDTLAKWAANPRCRELEMIGEEAGSKLVIERTSDIHSLAFATLVDVQKDAGEMLAWLARVVDLAPFETGTLERRGARPIVLVGPPRATVLDGADIEKLGKKARLLRKTRHGFLVEGDEEAIATALTPVVARNFERARGFTVGELAKQELGTVAEELGLSPAKSDEPFTTALFASGDRELAVIVGDVERPEGVDVEIRLRVGPHRHRSHTILTDREAQTRAAIERQLQIAAKKLPKEAPKAWAKLERAARAKR